MNTQKTKLWITISCTSIVVPLLGVAIVSGLNGADRLDEGSYVAGIVAIVSLACVVVSLVSLFLLRGWLKMLPLLGVAIQLIVAFLAYITYGLKDLKW